MKKGEITWEESEKQRSFEKTKSLSCQMNPVQWKNLNNINDNNSVRAQDVRIRVTKYKFKGTSCCSFGDLWRMYYAEKKFSEQWPLLSYLIIITCGEKYPPHGLHLLDIKQHWKKWVLLTVMALPCSLWFFSLCKARYASCRRFIHINAQPLGGIKSMDTMSPYSPNVSDSSSWCTNFDRCPTQRVVLHTGR